MGKSHNFSNASPSTASPKNEIQPPEQKIPKLVQCKSNYYNCKSHNCKSLHALQLSFFFLSTNDFGGRGRSQVKGFDAVKSKQKSTKNPFLLISFLTF
jgi:hypothetical protein